MNLARPSLATVALIVVAARAPSVRADPPVDGLSDNDRVLHAGLFAAMGVTFLVLNFPLGSTLAPTQCRWCDPDAFDVTVRNALVWHNTGLADTLSTIDVAAVAPLAAASLLGVGGAGHGWRRTFDDVAPVFEAGVAASLLQTAVKLAVARQRPYAHFAKPGTLVPSNQDNVSFFSGHTTLAFALAVSAGEVASTRGYTIAPAVWATGLTLAATTGYLRIAADQHYATDVLTGAAVGSLVGALWPLLVDRYLRSTGTTVTASTTPGLFAVSGRF